MVNRVSEPARAPPSDREHAELVRGLYRNTPVGVAGALFGAGVLCWVLLYIAPETRPRVEIWLALTVAFAVWQLGLSAWYFQAVPPEGDWRLWANRFVFASLGEGVRWGLGGVWLATPGHPEQQVWVCMVVACAASSSVSSVGSYVPAFYALLFPAMLPFVVWGALQADPEYRALALLALVLTASIAWLGRAQNSSLRHALRLRFTNLDLAEDLRTQKDLAERANLAKTQFLASASHDLRQPIHALGLFVGSLRRRPMEPENARLTRQISETVEAMTGLFDSLLDISQLDAGVVHPTPRSFALQPVLARICREQEAERGSRPVALRLVSTSAVVFADPVLLERMIRNLISNAVRHTERGRIVVGCRRGSKVSIEVHDTGPGIPAAQQAKVFEEYVQLANPERDRGKGLGLGLAITRRLSVLLECPVTLQSEPGRGTVFRILAPLAETDPVPEAADAPLPHQGLILVVDDDVAIQQGASALLKGWGFDVVTAGSGAELFARVDALRQPDLLICDWRLGAPQSAPEVIAGVRAMFGDDVPALLITGETAPSRLRDAHRTGLVLLHKPVSPGKLRAAIGNLARQPSPPPPAAVR